MVDSLSQKAHSSLPLRPHSSPRTPSKSKSDPPLASHTHAYTPNHLSQREQDASSSAEVSHLAENEGNTAEKGAQGLNNMSGADLATRESTLMAGTVDARPGGDAISRLFEQVAGQSGAVDGVDGVGGAGKSSVWSSPAPSPHPDGAGSVAGLSNLPPNPSITSAYQQATRPSAWPQGASSYDQAASSTERPPHFRNPSTANSSATARQPRQAHGQQPMRTSPSFGYNPSFPPPTEAPYTFPGPSYQAYSFGYPSPEQFMYETSPYSPQSGYGQSPVLQPMGSPMTGQPYFDGSGYPPYAPAPFSLQQQYYGSPAPISTLSPSMRPSSGSARASADYSSQPTSSGAEGSNGEVIYGSDGSPATSQEMLSLAQSQHYATTQQQQQPSPYVQYLPTNFQGAEAAASYSYSGQPFGSPTFGSPNLPEYSQLSYPISSHQSSQSFQPASFPSQAPASPYAMSPQLPPHQGQPQYPGQYRYYPPAPMPYAAYSPAMQPPPFAPSMSPPQVYAPPPELARGQLAQSKFHDAVYGTERESGQAGARDGRRGSFGAGGGAGFGGRALPKPPAHSPHALWVGNVPSDATHPELWRFFSARPVPATSPKYAGLHPSEIPPGVDLNSTGIESIHLISRSNCAFVNYASDIHLQHSIAVSNGLPLRPHDVRCKDLVCRVRKRDEDAKSGVGAQRTGGMHRDFVREKEREKREAEKREAQEAEGTGEVDGKGGPHHRHSTGSTTHSISTTSTTSSFLTKHFEKRYFILKSHDENDLKLSVERGLWMTQLHNEPVLDQAFHTAKDVFLIFGANKAGAFAGYARMMSPIRQLSNSSGDHRISGSSSDEPQDSISSSQYSSGRPATIHEEGNLDGGAYPRLFSPSEQRLALTSPLPLTPGGTKVTTSSAPSTMTPAARTRFEEEADRAVEEVGTTLDKLRLPDDVAVKSESLDPKLLARRDGGGIASIPHAVAEQQALGSSDIPGQTDEDGVWRKDQLPTAAERNARLEKMEDSLAPAEKDSKSSSTGWGRPFEVQWIKVARLPFSRTRRIFNQFNAGREVKISRDGTELEPSAGEALIAEFWREDTQITNGNGNSNGESTPTGVSHGGTPAVDGAEDSSAQVQPSGLVSASAADQSA